MATKPTTKPRWATVPTIGVDGYNNIIAPNSAKQDVGWEWKEKPPRQWFNWILNLIYKWVDWFDQQEQTHATDIATNVSDITTNTTNIATNTSNIATNISDIANLDIRVTANEILPKNYLSGFILEKIDAQNLRINKGICSEYTNLRNLELITSFTKSINVAWSIGSGNGGYGSASALAPNTWYNVFIIGKLDGTIDVGFDENVNATHLIGLSGFSDFRRIGSIFYNASSEISDFKQIGDDFIIEDTSWTEQNLSDITSGWHSDTLDKCPKGINFKVRCRITFTSGAGVEYISDGIITSPNTSNAYPFNISVGQLEPKQAFLELLTDITGKIHFTGNANFKVLVLGWKDYRGKK